MAAETNVIKKADLAKAREVDYTFKFNDDLRRLTKLLGITRMIPVADGTYLKAYKATGTLEDGAVAEGDVIPLSKYQTEAVNIAEITMKKWRKSTTAEAISRKGYAQAVTETDRKMIGDVRKIIKNDMMTYLASGEGVATGTTFQDTIAQIWGVLATKFEDTDAEFVYIMNPKDAANYLGTASITVQTEFGMKYIEGFLGMGDVLFDSSVPQGKIYGTAKENLVLEYVNASTDSMGEAFDFTTDADGLLGIHEVANYERVVFDTVVISAIAIFAERLDGVVIGTIGA